MAQVEVTMPKLGESVMEATITKWLIEEGGMIELDQVIVEIATDKVDSEVPAPFAGKLVKKLFNDGDVVKIGDAFAIVETDASAPSAAPETPAANSAPAAKEEVPYIPASNAANTPIPTKSEGGRFYSPLVKSIAQKENIAFNELETIPGTGAEGRLTKQDILNYIASGRKAAAQTTAPTATTPVVEKPAAASTAPAFNAPTVSISGEDQIIEMDRMRKLIAQNMVYSKQTSPHVTSFVEADVTNIVRWRDKVKKEFEKKYGEKLTFTPIIIEALTQAIREFPNINASVDGDRIIVRGKINIGMAAALPSGNLIVPVIKNADQMNLLGITKAVNDLANRARIGKLKPDEIQDGTYTLTNVGTFGNVMGTPIISQPQVAIMAAGAIRKRPAVIETEEGDVIAIRHMMFLSHSYDHRVVDGALGGKFVRRLGDILESFDVNRTI